MTWRVTILMLMIAGVLAFLAIVTMDRSGARRAMLGSGPLLESERFPLADLDRIESCFFQLLESLMVRLHATGNQVTVKVLCTGM